MSDRELMLMRLSEIKEEYERDMTEENRVRYFEALKNVLMVYNLRDSI